MPHESREFDVEEGGAGETDSGDDIFDDDQDYSTDLPGEDANPFDDDGAGGATSGGTTTDTDDRDRDDDDDDDDDDDQPPGVVDSDRDVGGAASDAARSKVGTTPADRGTEPPPEEPPGPVGSGRDDEPSDVSDEEVTAATASRLRQALEERYGENYDVALDQVGPGNFAVELTSDDYYDRYGVVRYDENRIRGQLMAQEARLEERTGRDVDIQKATGGLEFVDKGEASTGGRIPESPEFDQRTLTTETEGGTRVIGSEPERMGPEFIGPRRESRPLLANAAGFEFAGPEGQRVDADPSSSTRQILEYRLEAKTGIDLDPGRDIEFSEVSGRQHARLTEEGAEKVARRRSGDEFEREVHAPFELLPTVDEKDATLEDIIAGTQEEIRAWAGRQADVVRGGYWDAIQEDPETETPAERQSTVALEEALSAPAYLLGAVRAGEELREFELEAVDVAREEGLVDDASTPERSGAAAFTVEESTEFARQAYESLEAQARSPVGRARLMGSLVGTAALMGGAGAISGRAGAAARLAIQPGEELATMGLSRAAPGVARRFPGGRIDNEEIALVGLARGARAAGRATRRGGRAARRPVRRVTRAARGRTARLPSVSVEADPDSPMITVDPLVRQQVRDLVVESPVERLRAGARTARAAPRVAVGAAAAGAARARRAVDTGVQTARAAPRRAGAVPGEARLGFEVGLDTELVEGPGSSSAFRAGRRSGAAVRRSGQLAEDVGYILGRETGELIAEVERVPTVARQEFTRAELLAEDLGYRAGVRARRAAARPGNVAEDIGYRAGVAAGRGVSRLEAFDPSAAGVELARSVERGARVVAARPGRRAEALGYSLGYGIARSSATAGEIALELSSLPGRSAARARSGVGVAARSTRQRITKAELYAEEFGMGLGFTAGQRLARIQELGLSGRDVARLGGRARAAPREALAGFAIGSGRAGLSDLPRFESYPGQIATGRAFEFGYQAGAGQRVGREGLRRRAVSIGSRLAAGREAVAAVPDLAIRVEPGVPRRAKVSRDDLEAGDVEGLERMLDELGIETLDRNERPSADVEDIETADIETEAGEGQLAVLEERAAPVETSEVETDARVRGPLEMAPVEEIDEPGPVEEPVPRMWEGPDLSEPAGILERPETGLRPVGEVRAVQPGRLELARARETTGEVTSEFDTDLDMEALRELEFRRAELTAELEFAAEIDGEGELESDGPPQLPELGSPGPPERLPERELGEPGDDWLAPGWFTETVAALAGVSREAPSQGQLREQPRVQHLLGELPVLAELEGTEAEKEAIEDVRMALTPGDGRPQNEGLLSVDTSADEGGVWDGPWFGEAEDGGIGPRLL